MKKSASVLTRVTVSRGLVPSSGVFFFFFSWRELSLQLRELALSVSLQMSGGMSGSHHKSFFYLCRVHRPGWLETIKHTKYLLVLAYSKQERKNTVLLDVSGLEDL